MGDLMDGDFDTDERYAEKLDEEDLLSRYRDEFYLPEGKIYFNGNSLGLMSKKSEDNIERIMDEWKELAIEGWTEGEVPWFYYAETVGGKAADLVGAQEDEVVLTGTTTFNIHQLISTFYEPEDGKRKILADELNFPTDIYALKSQIELQGGDFREDLVLVESEDGRILDEEKIVDMMDDVSLILLPSVLYKSGQLLDMEYLAKEAHSRDIPIGFDCSHSVGVVPHEFDEWGVDFAMWCSYKYLNGGPGSPAFLYLNQEYFDKEPGLWGWFGYKKDEQFDMRLDFDHSRDAGGWQVSSPNIAGAAAVGASLEMIRDAGIHEIRKKSERMTSYLIYLIDELLSDEPYDLDVGSPRDDRRRGGHVALERDEDCLRINRALKDRGFVTDFRPPDIIRVAPVPLYNTYHDIWTLVDTIKKIIDTGGYERYSDESEGVS